MQTEQHEKIKSFRISKKEDLVAIVSIAKHVTQDKCQLAAEYIKKSGLDLVDLNDTILPRKGMFS